MNVLYDLVFLSKEEQGGISRMWLEYFKLMPQSAIDASFVAMLDSSNMTQEYLKKENYFNCPVIIEKTHKNHKYYQSLLKLGFFRNFKLPAIIPNDTQIFHSTDYINPLFRSANTKLVTTIHDMVFWDQKERFKRNLYYWDKLWCTYHSLRISDRVITVSKASRNSIIAHFPWAEKKISVIYHGLANSFHKLEVKPRKKKYFMFVGGRNTYKNFPLLLSAFSYFLKEYPEWELCIVGENRDTYKKECEEYKKLGITNQIIDHGLVSEKKLISLLEEATALVIPSLNEGFNFPLLEAMAVGCPVLCSDLPISREIGAEFPIYFSTDKQSLLVSMREVVLSELDHGKLLKAQEHARTFDWGKSFNQLVDVYESCIN